MRIAQSPRPGKGQLNRCKSDTNGTVRMKEGGQMNMKKTKVKLTTQTLCFIGLFGALSTVLMLFKLPLPFAPAFMKLDVAELPAILGSFMFGPVAGEFIVIIKLALNLLINGTDSMYVGELSNLLLSSAYVLSASLFYQRRKTRKNAAIALVTGVLATSIRMSRGVMTL